MKYFDLVPVGQLVTVSDIESIARFSVKDFYDYKRLDENGCRTSLMFYMNGH
jgi:hypothetical protein